MSNVPQELIEEARKRGIVPGAMIQQRFGAYARECFKVAEYEDWGYSESGRWLSCGKAKGLNLFAMSLGDWATVITPAPKEEEGLKEGDAVECGPAMRAAIVELARELGICNGEDGGLIGSKASGVWNMHGTGLVNVCSNFHDLNTITPEAFISRMRVTAALPKPIKIDGHEVKYEAGHIKVGCQTIPNATVRAIAEKLID